MLPQGKLASTMNDMFFQVKEMNIYLYRQLKTYLQNMSSIAKSEHPEMFVHGPYTPHVMRHTTATHLIEAGVPLAIVKNILGHSSIQTTQIYLDISQQTVDRTLEEWNEKWFSQNNPSDTEILKDNNQIPDFLK